MMYADKLQDGDVQVLGKLISMTIIFSHLFIQ